MPTSTTHDTYDDILVNGTDYAYFCAPPKIQRLPDTLAGTCTLTEVEVDQFTEAGNDSHVGAAIVVTGVRPDDSHTAHYLFRGNVIDKAVPEEGSGRFITLNCIDRMYALTRQRVDFSATSRTISKALYPYFKDDGGGGGDPNAYCSLAELREGTPGGATWVPREDMDKLPFSFMRRTKTGEEDVWYSINEYTVAYGPKLVVFNSVQLGDEDDGGTPNDALPLYYADGGPTTPGGWTYKCQATFFVAPLYPRRNTDANTAENILRNTVLGGDPTTTAGGAGFAAAQLNKSYSYTKGSTVYIPDRISEGMLVTGVLTGDTVTVSDGGGWAVDDTFAYTDLYGVVQSYNVDAVSGDSLTLDDTPTGLIANMRATGGEHKGCIVTLTGGDTTVGMSNYTDVVIGGTTYFIREIRDTTTLVIVNADEDDDFSGLGASGTLTYPTIEYTGLQIGRYTWRRDDGYIADMIEDWFDNGVLPRNYRFIHDYEDDVIRGKLVRQYRALVTSSTAAATGYTDIVVDDVDGFYPGQYIGWQDTDDDWHLFLIDSIDYTTETITVVDDDGTADTIAASDYIHANCAQGYRKSAYDHVTSLEHITNRIELVSTANQAFPLLTSTEIDSVGYDDDPPTGGWSETGDTTPPENGVVDNTVVTGYVVYRGRTGAGLLTSPEEWGLDVPWAVMDFDLGEDKDIDEILFQVGYSKTYLDDDTLKGYNVTTLPIFSVHVKSAGGDYAPCSRALAGKQFDPRNPNAGISLYKCDLIKRFRYVRIYCDRPYFYKQGESGWGTPTRRMDIPILNFQLYERPKIRYESDDEDLAVLNGHPDGTITPFDGETPFAQLTNKGGVIQSFNAPTKTLTLESAAVAAKYTAGDAVALWDVSAGAPFATANEVASVTGADVVLTDALPAALASGDKLGDVRRWMLDVSDTWRDLYAPNVVDRMFASVLPVEVIVDEGAVNAYECQLIAVTRLYEDFLTSQDGQYDCMFDPAVHLFQQLIVSDYHAPELVMGLGHVGFKTSFQTRQYNVTAEEVAGV